MTSQFIYGNILNFTLHTGVLSRASLLSAASSSSLCVFACKAALSCFRFTRICVTACDLFAEQNRLWRDWAAGVTKLHLQPMQVMPAISRKISRKYLHNILSDTDHWICEGLGSVSWILTPTAYRLCAKFNLRLVAPYPLPSPCLTLSLTQSTSVLFPPSQDFSITFLASLKMIGEMIHAIWVVTACW